MKEMLLKRFDADKNGELSDSEIAAAAKHRPGGGKGQGPKGAGKEGKKPGGKRGQEK